MTEKVEPEYVVVGDDPSAVPKQKPGEGGIRSRHYTLEGAITAAEEFLTDLLKHEAAVKMLHVLQSTAGAEGLIDGNQNLTRLEGAWWVVLGYVYGPQKTWRWFIP